MRRHRLVLPAQQLRRDRAVNATADVQNAMVLGFCRLYLLVRRGGCLGRFRSRGGRRGYPGAGAGAGVGSGAGEGFVVPVAGVRAVRASTRPAARGMDAVEESVTTAKSHQRRQSPSQLFLNLVARDRGGLVFLRVWDDSVMGTFVFPFRSDHVWLRARRQTWKALAPRIKRTLSDATKHIVTIREAIAADAQVHSMPPVEIVAELWAHGGAFMHGRMLPLERGKAWEIGVQLTAPAAVHHDSTLIRSILVHEFAHCFFLMEKCVRDGGESRDSHNAFDDSADRERLADPRDWFGAEDVKRFLYQDDPAAEELEQNFMDLAGLLPLVDPDLRYRVNGALHYPTDVRDRIEELLRREQG